MFLILKQIPRVCFGSSRGKAKLLLSSKTSRPITRRNISSESEAFINNYLSAAFVQADKDKDGQASSDEIKNVIKMFFIAKGKPESPLLNPFIDQMVFKGNPTLSQEEFLSRLKFSYSFLLTLAEEIIKMKFTKNDGAKTGKLDKEQIANFLDELYPIADKTQVDHFLNKYDKDKDGSVTLEEIIEFTRKELLALKL